MQPEKKPGSSARVKKFMESIVQSAKRNWIFLVILALGIFARTWEFNKVPPGLNPDEASIGVEAYYLYKFGVDRNGVAYPVHLISWGSGQNALYAYILIPFIVLMGFHPETIRLPMMLFGILSLPLMYLVGKRLFGSKYGLVVMFCAAVSPWHIVNARWAVESNILPFLFLAGFWMLLKARNKGAWFVPAAACFAFCLYAYGTAYVAIPVFLAFTLPVTFRFRTISIGQAGLASSLFVLLALPILLFVMVNTFKWNTIALGPLTIPRLPVEARYESLAAVFDADPSKAVVDNLMVMTDLLWRQEDKFDWNFVQPYGYFYKLTFPLIAAGFLLLLGSVWKKSEQSYEHWLLASWIISALVIGIVHPVNLTRINLIFTPLLFCFVMCLLHLDKYISQATPVTVVLLLVGFVFFTSAYHGESYQKRAEEVFNAGIIPAMEYATENSSSLICITESTRFAYIYTFFTNKLHPSQYLDTIEWILPPKHPVDPARTPRALGPYRFDLSDCTGEPTAVFVLKLKETPPNSQIDYRIRKFTKFQVFVPKPAP
jgi:hypothetical protein